MYQSHWGLHQSPFRDCRDPQDFYQSPTHDEALARLQFLVDERRRLGLLMGPPGSGKSLVLEVFAAQLGRRGLPVAKVNLLGIEPAELLWLLATQFGLNPGRSDSTAGLWRKVTDRLLEHRYQQLSTAILLDDADQASPQVLVQLVRLADHDPSPEAKLTLVLAGQQQRMGRLGDALLGRAELRVDLDPWEESDTEGYLKTSLRQAGCQTPVFAEPAVARLHELSHGIPRRVRQLADLALVAGAGRDLAEVDADVVESVWQELSVEGGGRD
jgi:type II secretory pathway predicted ATPase ExeA